ncbi:hypothetical protein HZB05_00180 [Candidatus Wolfebacteria bacterium]|nr:hypothetical protein [Candidatus Wolfebacteria bacterium]
MPFKKAVLMPFSEYYKVKPDNDYWNKQNKYAFWYRIIAMTALLTIFFSATSISKKQYPWELMKKYLLQASAGIAELSKDFPNRFLAYPRLWLSQYYNLSTEEIETALNDKFVRVVIFGLVKRSETLKFSELGGAIFLKNGKLDFYVLDNPVRLIAVDISDTLNTGDPEKLLPKYSQYKKIIQEKFGYEVAISKMGANLEKRPTDKDAARRILGLFIFLCSYDHQINFDVLLKLFYDGSKGQYIGNFHIHQYGDPPSSVDLESSEIENKFVIVRISDKKATFYWLKNQKIALEKDLF